MWSGGITDITLYERVTTRKEFARHREQEIKKLQTESAKNNIETTTNEATIVNHFYINPQPCSGPVSSLNVAQPRWMDHLYDKQDCKSPQKIQFKSFSWHFN